MEAIVFITFSQRFNMGNIIFVPYLRK